MEIAKTATRNALFLSIADILSKIINFFYVVLVARYLDIDNYGVLMFAIAFVELCSIGLDLGLSTILTREIAKDKLKMNVYFNNIIFIKIILSFITLLFVSLILFFAGYSKVINFIIIILFVAAIINSFASLPSSIFQAFNKMQYLSICRILASIIIFLGALVLIKFNASVFQFSFIYLISSIFILIFSFFIYLLNFKGKLSLAYDKILWLKLVKLALPFGISVIFVTIYYRIDSVMLKFFRTDAEVGLYNIAYGFIFALSFVQGIIITAIFPIMSKLYVDSKILLKNLYENSFKMLAILAFPIGIGITLLANKIILLIYGNKFESSVLSLQILVWALVFMFLNVSTANLLNVINKQKIVAFQIILATIFNILANIYAIPRFGPVGASITTVLSEILAFTLLLSVSYKLNYGLNGKILLNLLKIIFCSALMGIIIIFLKDLNLFFVVLIGSFSYFLLIYILKVVDKNNINLIKNLIINK